MGSGGLKPDSGPQIAFNYVACGCSRFYASLLTCLRFAFFLPASDPSGPCFVLFCVDDLRVPLIKLRIYLATAATALSTATSLSPSSL